METSMNQVNKNSTFAQANALSAKKEVTAVESVNANSSFQSLFSQQLQSQPPANVKPSEAFNAQKSVSEGDKKTSQVKQTEVKQTEVKKPDQKSSDQATDSTQDQSSVQDTKDADKDYGKAEIVRSKVKATSKQSDTDDNSPQVDMLVDSDANATVNANMLIANGMGNPQTQLSDKPIKEQLPAESAATQDNSPRKGQVNPLLNDAPDSKKQPDVADFGDGKAQILADNTDKVSAKKDAFTDQLNAVAARDNSASQSLNDKLPSASLTARLAQAETELATSANAPKPETTTPNLNGLNPSLVAYQAQVGQNSSVGASNLITPALGKPAWEQAIGQKVVYMVGAGEQSATLTLNPPDLGPLQVVISVNNEKADTTFISQNLDVRKALEDGMPTLRDMMNKAGIELGQANVNSQQQQSQQEKNHASTPATAQLRGTASDTSDESLSTKTTGARVVRQSSGVVDTFA